jgi:hypothetical protein
LAKVRPIAGCTAVWFTPVFDRVFNGQNLARRLVELDERGGERRGFSRSGRPGRDDHAKGKLQGGAKRLLVARLQADLIERDHAFSLAKQSNDRAFAMGCRHRCDAKIDLGAGDRQPRAAVLRQSPIGDVQSRHDFEARQ